MAEPLSFTARLEPAGKNARLAVPADPNELWGAKSAHYVSGTLDGQDHRTKLEQVDGGWAIVVTASRIEALGLAIDGDVEVTIAPEQPMADGVAADFAALLAGDEQCRYNFESQPSFYRKNLVRWIESAKRAETRERRLAEAMEMLRAGERMG